MSNSTVDKKRRSLLGLAVASAVVPVSALIYSRGAAGADLPQLSEDDPSAKALGYVHDANSAPADKRKAGTFCKNCNLIKGAEGTWRGCAIFPGKAVNADGWCAAWVGRV